MHRSRSVQASAVLIVFCGCLIRQVWVDGENVEYLIAGIVGVLTNFAINKRLQIKAGKDYD